MKLAVAQTRPAKGDIEKNIEVHIKLSQSAISFGANLIVFPELSLSGYEPSLSKQLATDQDDKRLDIFQNISDRNNIIIVAGIPTIGTEGIHISMIIFQPHQTSKTYSKQQLHCDEYPFFVPGKNELTLSIENKKIAPAICYESLQPGHSEKASKNGANIYMASVAKSENGIKKAYKHYPEVARNYAMIVLMSNCVGKADDFETVGQSAIWNDEGELVGMLNENDQGILIFDTETREVIEHIDNEMAFT